MSVLHCWEQRGVWGPSPQLLGPCPAHPRPSTVHAAMLRVGLQSPGAPGPVSCPLSSSLLVSRMGTPWALGHVPWEKRQVCPWHLGPWTQVGIGIRLLGGRWMDSPPPSLLQAPVALATLLGGAGPQQLYQARWDHTTAEVVGSRGRPWRPGREDMPRVSFSASAISFSGIHAGEDE